MAPVFDALPNGAPELAPLTVSEVHQLVLSMDEPDAQHRFRLGWSR